MLFLDVNSTISIWNNHLNAILILAKSIECVWSDGLYYRFNYVE